MRGLAFILIFIGVAVVIFGIFAMVGGAVLYLSDLFLGTEHFTLLKSFWVGVAIAIVVGIIRSAQKD